jgi:hypothetical protein
MLVDASTLKNFDRFLIKIQEKKKKSKKVYVPNDKKK